MIEEVELVLTVGVRHAAALYRLPYESPAEIHTLREYATDFPDREGIPDPYELTITAHRSTLQQLYEYVERVVDRLAG
jgi:protein-tyrosine-phosphatase